MTSFRTFVSDLPENLLREFLKRHNIELPAETLPATQAEKARLVEDELANCPLGTRGALEAEMERINQLATAPGEIAVEDSLPDYQEELPSARARSLWLYLRDRACFERAEEIYYSNDKRGGRSWTGFRCRTGARIVDDETTRAVLVEALKKHFDCANIQVEIFGRIGPAARIAMADDADGDSQEAWQIMIYKEDRPQSERAFAPSGELILGSRRPVSEASIVYEPNGASNAFPRAVRTGRKS